MRNFKKILFLVLSLALMLTFIACGDDENSQSSSVSESESQIESESESVSESGKNENAVTVKFDTKGGTSIPDAYVQKDEKLSKPSDPEKVGYTLDGWYIGAEEWSFVGYVVTEDMTLTAKWVPVEYTITFAGNVETAPIKYTIENDVTLPDITSSGYYMVDGWFEDEALTKPISKFEKGTYGDKTIYAKTTYSGFITRCYGSTLSVTDCDPNATAVVIRSTYNGKSVTTISARAFSGCSKLTSVTIPDSVTTIYDRAFDECSNLTSVTIGNRVTKIGGYAFHGCSSLTSVTIPDSVTTIGYRAFEGCTALTSVTIGNSVTEIGDSAFSGCSKLTSVTIPNSVTEIGVGTFSGCSSLTSVTIPDSVTTIGYHAFDDCSSLTSITIPDGVTEIDEDAFEGCSSLTIYCEATSQPSGWYDEWNAVDWQGSLCPTYWYSESEPTGSGNYWHYGTNGEIVVWE